MPPGKRVIGVDEAGKGDFFGPLVVAGILIKESENKKLAELGVRDSKLISDGKIIQIDEQLRSRYPHFVHTIAPEDYNSQYLQIKNLNKLLAQAHGRVISELISKHGAEQIILDKFGKSELVETELAQKNITVELLQVEGGEKHPPVAAASILARAGFIAEIDKLSRAAGFEIPKGAASHVDEAARRLLKKHGDKALSKFVKIHFKNFNRVLSPKLFD